MKNHSKKLWVLILAIVIVLSVVFVVSISVFASPPTAVCTVTGAKYDAGETDSYVTADVTFTSDTAFTAGIFTVEANDLVLSDCSVVQSVGGEEPEIHLDLAQNKIIFAGFSDSQVYDVRSYSKLTLSLMFTIADSSLENIAAGTKWAVNVKEVDIINDDEEDYLVEDSTGYIHIHKYADEWSSDGDGHWNPCLICDRNVKTPHNYVWIVTKEPTDEEPGLKEEICSVCGYKSGETLEIPYDTHTPGDINSDGKVNNKDLTRLFQYLSDWDVEVNEAALDVNGDGKINNKDLTRLFQYLSDWDVEIF